MSLSRKAALALVGSAAVALVAAGAGVAQAEPDSEGRYYGSIALEPKTGKTGAAWNYPGWGESDADALAECGRQDCYVAVRFVNGCGAIAASSDGNWAVGTGRDRAAAERAAIAALGPLDPPFPNFGSSAPKRAQVWETHCTPE
ncbi:uncharacterized protein DUF4189 [Nocardia tenerifensis]|uniref:Uncharacterized protein DUF4189 n=1 Tax=Nocardia tenerifensis TaxID=228006 RepID=A0A318JWI5_9NOCA|nr:DUF4189 domain-containing protein [Nocardia tenerifensis]PXX59091.1 uncharacterized protein DUF4189 [Nocardia tenerifensis]